MSSFDIHAARRRLRQDPQKCVDAARNGSRTELMEVANLWQELGPQMLRFGVVDAFLVHLDLKKSASVAGNVDNAFMALIGIAKVGNFLGAADDHPYVRKFIAAWPGIFRWCSVLHDARIASATVHPQSRLSTRCAITGAVYGLSSADDVKRAMAETPGSVELLARLWLLEDPGEPTMVDIPTGVAALESVMRYSDAARLDRFLGVAGSADGVAKRALKNFKFFATKLQTSAAAATISADLVNQLSRAKKHPLRTAFLVNGVVSQFGQALLHVAEQLDRPDAHPYLLHTAISLFGYMWNCLESTDGFTWIREAVSAGLPVAFARMSPHFRKAQMEDDEGMEIAFKLFSDLLPRYMVYRSVLDVLVPQVAKAEQEYGVRVRESAAKNVWKTFRELLAERQAMKDHAKAVKGKSQACDNVKCSRIDDRNKFKKCAGCQSTYYCSKECQLAAWKEGDHKNVCKLKQQERLEGKLNPISKGDAAFFHALATEEARRHSVQLRAAARAYPEPGPYVARIDFTKVPEAYGVWPLATYAKREELLYGLNARTDAMLERAAQNADRVLLIESMVSKGECDEAVMTMVACDFWGAGEKAWMTLDEDLDDLDGMSEKELLHGARRVLDLFMQRMQLDK